MAQVTIDMDTQTIAKTIFFDFDINQSCKIEGFEWRERQLYPKGEIVCDLLWELDRKHNCYVKGSTAVRIKKRPKNSIGGYAAHKIFKWDYIKTEETVKFTIWRIQ